jgi:hypothetical protein
MAGKLINVKGHLEVLKWAIENGCAWNEFTIGNL